MNKQNFSFQIVDHGVEHGQFFQGHGVSTDWTHCVTGVGDTPGYALEDALEQMATCGARPDQIALVRNSEDGRMLMGSQVDAHDECGDWASSDAMGVAGCGDIPPDWHDDCELAYRISLDWKYS